MEAWEIQMGKEGGKGGGGDGDSIMGVVTWGMVEAMRVNSYVCSFILKKKKRKILTKSPMAQRVSRQVQTAG